MPRTAPSNDVSPTPRSRGGGWGKVLLVLVLVLGILGAGAIYVLHKVTHLSIFSAAGCTASSATGSVSLDLQQARYASTIAAVGLKMSVPQFGIEVAEATAMQESKLHDLTYGDRDSVGLFQQRPSQGWGTQAQIMDPVYASTRFYGALTAVPNWQSLSLTEAAQAVQHSGAPEAYAAHETDARVLVAVFTGGAGDGLGCTLDGPTFAAQTKGAALLTGRGQAVVDALRDQFGWANVGTVGGISPDGLSFTVAAPGSFTGPAAVTRSWAFANWAAAQAENLGVAEVSYGGKVWSAAKGDSGWRTDGGASTGTVRILMTSGG